MKLTAKTAFSWAHRGVEVEQFEAGQVIDTENQDLIEVATAEGWADPEGEKSDKPAQNKAQKSAPETK